MIVVAFVISRLFIVLGSFIAQRTVPYLGFFPYKELLTEFGLPSWLTAFANFDGIHYLQIAKNGYSQWEQAFFPLYPLLIRAVSYIVPNYLIAALIISYTSFAVGLIFFSKLLKSWGIKTSWPMLFLLSFPTAFFFSAIYTEGLFFMLFVLSLYFLQKKNYWLAGLCAALSSATRLIGFFLIIPFFFHFLAECNLLFKRFALHVSRYTLLVLSPLLGLLSYMIFLWTTTGDPLFFFNSQPVFGANRSTHLILLPQVYYRYLKILFTASHDFQWYLSLTEMGIFSLVFVIVILSLTKDLINIRLSSFWQSPPGRGAPRIKTGCMDSGQARVTEINLKHAQYERIGLGLFSLANIILPTLTGTFSSIPRYALFSLSFFLYLSQIKSRGVKIGIAVAFISLQIILLSLFIQGYFVG